MDKCPYCNAETRPGDNFCLNCGNRLVPSTPSPQQAPTVAGDATLPAPEDWAPPVPEASQPARENEWREEENFMTIANTSLESSPLPGDHSSSSSSAAPVAQAIMDKVENSDHPARLILSTDTGEVLQEYPLEKSEISIGRAPTSDILLSKDKLTSRRHATVSFENGNYIIRDERSANGTFVNGQQLEEMAPRILQHGDHIGIGEHELVFQSHETVQPDVDIESMPTITVSPSDVADITYRTREDELLAADSSDDFGTRSMNGDDSTNSATVLPEPIAPPVSPTVNEAPPAIVPAPEVPAEPIKPAEAINIPEPAKPAAPTSNAGVTFNRLMNLPRPTLPDVAPVMAALTALDGQVASLQQQLNASQETLRNHDEEITQTSNELRTGVRRVSERMDNTIADVARSREQLAWAELMQLMDDVMNNPRDIEYVTKLARKARELNKVFQIHQNVLNTLAECTSLLRSLLGEDK